MLGRKLTLVKENSFTRRAQQSHLDNGGVGRRGGGCRGQVGTYSGTEDTVSEDGVIAALMLCTVYLMLHTLAT